MGRPSHKKIVPAAKTELVEPRSLLAQAGVTCEAHWQIISSGPLNQVFYGHKQEEKLALKYYGKQRGATARFLTEQAWYELVRPFAPQRLPEPLLWNAAHRFALFKWAEGTPLAPQDLEPPVLADLLAFLTAIHRARPAAVGRAFPALAGACFSLHERWEAVGHWVQQAAQAIATTKKAKTLALRLELSWQIISQVLLQRAEKMGMDPAQILPLHERMLSAPDWGLHQALRLADGHVVFLDFDGAGWEDPAWWLAGLFAHWKLPLPLERWNSFVPNATRLLGSASITTQRAALLLPAARLQQICLQIIDATTQPSPLAARQRALKAAEEALDDLAQPRWWQPADQLLKSQMP